MYPSEHHLFATKAARTPGRSALRVRDLDGKRLPQLADRVRAAILNTGFALPNGIVEVVVESHQPGCDLAVAIAVMLADPAHQRFRAEDLMAWGSLRLDGSLDAPQTGPLVNDLPSEPWIARFWHVDEALERNEKPVLTLVEVTHLSQAWESVLGLHDIGRMLATTN
jgi:hypothetical protein